jgi:hypothetical protein
MSVRMSFEDAGFDSDNAFGVILTPVRYHRIVVSANAGDGTGLLSAMEIELRASSGGPTFVLLPGDPIVTASSENPGNVIGNAFDGNTAGTSYTSLAPTTTYPVTIDIDLGAGNEEPFAELSWLPRADAPNRSPGAFEVFSSVDGVTYHRVLSQSGITGWTAGVAKVFTRPNI